MEETPKLLYSNTPIYLPSFLKQYGKEVLDYRLVNWEGSLPSYQLQFIDRTQEETPSPDGPEIVYFSFMGKNVWLWEDEYELLCPILDRVVQMTIRYQHRLSVGPVIPIFDENSKQVEDFEQDLISGFFRVHAILTP